jgi:hypothetical protein
MNCRFDSSPVELRRAAVLRHSEPAMRAENAAAAGDRSSGDRSNARHPREARARSNLGGRDR